MNAFFFRGNSRPNDTTAAIETEQTSVSLAIPMFQLLLNEQISWAYFQSESWNIVLDMPVNLIQDF